MPNATVAVRNELTGRAFTVATDEQGLYRSVPVPAGQYRVEVEAAGFKKSVRSAIELQVQQTAVEDFRLEVGALTEQIEVRASAPLLATTEASQGQVIDERRVAALPLNGRDYIRLALLSEGTAEPTGGRIGGFSSAGMLTTKNNYLIDGIDNNSRQIAAESTQAETVKPSIDAIQEFKVQTNAYSAEFGSAAGAVINLTIKSGTNQLHGTAYEFLRNEKLDARNFFDRNALPPLKRNQYGFFRGRSGDPQQDLLLRQLREAGAAGVAYRGGHPAQPQDAARRFFGAEQRSSTIRCPTTRRRARASRSQAT